jgi:hypothetical protein
MPDNGIGERFHRTVLDEFYRIAFRKKIYHTIDELQTDLDTWLHRWGERAEAFAVFDLEVQDFLRLGRARSGQDRAVAQRARAEFHRPLEPADRPAIGQRLGGLVEQRRFILDHVETSALREEPPTRVSFIACK